MVDLQFNQAGQFPEEFSGWGTSSGSKWAAPPEPINQLLDAPTFFKVLFSANHEWLIELEQPPLATIAELAEPEIAVAGFRFNPRTNGPIRHHTYRSLRIRKSLTGTPQLISLPEPTRIGFLRGSPDGKRLAFTLTQASGLELWVLDLVSGIPNRLTEPILNAVYGTPYRWLSNETLICKFIPADRGMPPTPPSVPLGPLIQENLGRKAPNRTYTNLLKHPHDEAVFEHYVTSTLELVTLRGQRTCLVSAALVEAARPSPDARYILLSTLHRPFSYQLPASCFSKQIQVLDQTGQPVHQVADLPLSERPSTKFDAVRTGRRRVFWRSDRPATLYWVEALDEGDPTQAVPYRDALFEQDAPFQNPPRQLWQSEFRFDGVAWGREAIALVGERHYDSRQLRIWQINPAQPEIAPQLLIERHLEDKYADPGNILTTPGPYGRDVLLFAPDGKSVYFSGRGASAQGVYPFLDRRDLTTGDIERLWQCQDPYYEAVIKLLDHDAYQFITVRQSQTEPPNSFLCDRMHHTQIPLTHNVDPAPEFARTQKTVIRYQRADGVQLSARLYLPAGYEPERDGPLPTVFWVYPEEFKDPDLAGQVGIAENTFRRPRGASVLFLLTQGYAVVSNPKLPIVGAGNAEPNDRYVEQLLAGIEAAVDYVVDRGIAERSRLGIGGHSYGAFTTANVLAHSNLFRAGVAMSGAYNRTLTPFGFQGEQRTFWEAPETYIQMSAFTHASKVATPLLLIHGANDSNAGTYPMQTERFYEALKGLGGTVRWVVLPLEGHSYQSREAIGHVLWEMVTWYDRYLKPQDNNPCLVPIL